MKYETENRERKKASAEEFPDQRELKRKLLAEKRFRKKYSKKRAGGMANLILSAVTLMFFSLLGLMLPLRPQTSELEKRTLKTFPEFSAAGILNGSYFSDVSEWYSDTYPLRDTWLAGNDKVKALYGLQTTQVITGNAVKDDIPDVSATQSSGKTETETSAEAVTTAAVTTATVTTAVAETPVSEGQTSAQTEPTAGTELAAGTDPAEQPSTLAPITAQVSNGLFVNNDRAFGIYYFNRTAADTYIAAVNRTAAQLAGQANVYVMLVPLSTTFYLSEETIRGTDASDEKSAMNYYYSQLSSQVKPVMIYDTLSAHSSEYLYFRTDHHWNGRGAYYAYAEYAKSAGFTAHALEEYTEVDYPGYLGSYYVNGNKPAAMESNPDTVEAFLPLTCTTMTFTQTDGLVLNWPIINDVTNYSQGNKYSCFAGADNPFSEIHNQNVQNGKTALVIKESYGNAIIPYLADHYETLYWIDYRTYNGSIIEFARANGVTDLIFVNGTDPISSVDSMNRLSALLP